MKLKNILTVKPIDAGSANQFLAAHHPGGDARRRTRFAYATYQGGNLIGVLACGHPVSTKAVKHLDGVTSHRECIELLRLWLYDDAPRNSESFTMAAAVRDIRRSCPECKYVVTYNNADFLCYGHRAIGMRVSKYTWTDGVKYALYVLPLNGGHNG